MRTYGYCPICGGKGVSRERRPNGNDKCENGHVYRSKDALKKPPQLGFDWVDVKKTPPPKDGEWVWLLEHDGIECIGHLARWRDTTKITGINDTGSWCDTLSKIPNYFEPTHWRYAKLPKVKP